jgi:hypothetical protein
VYVILKAAVLDSSPQYKYSSVVCSFTSTFLVCFLCTCYQTLQGLVWRKDICDCCIFGLTSHSSTVCEWTCFILSWTKGYFIWLRKKSYIKNVPQYNGHTLGAYSTAHMKQRSLINNVIHHLYWVKGCVV